jgi:hypothetical protein
MAMVVTWSRSSSTSSSNVASTDCPISIGAIVSLNARSSPPASAAVSAASEVHPMNRSSAVWYTHDLVAESTPSASAVRSDSQQVRRPCSIG